jgi:pyruvyltransferase
MNFRSLRLWKAAKAIAIDPARRFWRKQTLCGRIPLMWCRGRNWGDALSPVLVELLSGRSVVHVAGLHHHRHLAIGSILGGANERAEVWGSGFISADERIRGGAPVVHAVRGPLTRDALIKQGVDCPEIYGDPALLLPRFFDPNVEKSYRVGVIPHYIDKGHPWLNRIRQERRALIIDIEAGIAEFVRAVKSCEAILSSSLHGLICADAYGIPNAQIKLSDNVVGGDFKFNDYRFSIGGDRRRAIVITETTKLSAAAAAVEQNELNIDLRGLMLACPYLSESLRAQIADPDEGPCGLPGALSSTLAGATELSCCN